MSRNYKNYILHFLSTTRSKAWTLIWGRISDFPFEVTVGQGDVVFIFFNLLIKQILIVHMHIDLVAAQKKNKSVT